ncbi:MAG: PAS domain-containing sensor histidine kinase [Syntrophales bacterium]|nr:PAS domain-containing sensor histidine kinase [Syntrophales bacterium]MDD5642769.1 PAS domain-containing sensor histidine kinase [Syntrophales bacterium]
MLRRQYKVIVIAVALGLAVVLVNSIFDYYFFYEPKIEPKTFLDLLLFDIPPREVYKRTIFMMFSVIMGILVFHYFIRMTESEGRYRELFDNVNDAIFVVSPAGEGRGTFIEANAVVYKNLGYGKEEILSLTPADLDEHYALGQKSDDNTPLLFETVIRAKNGKKIPVEVHSHHFQLSGRPAILSIIRDITVRKQNEIKLLESEHRLRELTAQLLNIQEIERSRISKELHDELGQTMLLLKFQVSAIHEKLADPATRKESSEVLKNNDEAIENVRRLAKDLSPTVLESLGVSAAVRFLLEEFGKSSNIAVTADIDEVNDLLAPKEQRNIYRIFQEALTNIGRHAQAGHVKAMIKRSEQSIAVLIQDDGKGFEVDKVLADYPKARRFGLATIKERVQLIGGSLDLKSELGSGTKITFSVPADRGEGDGTIPHLAGR